MITKLITKDLHDNQLITQNTKLITNNTKLITKDLYDN